MTEDHEAEDLARGLKAKAFIAELSEDQLPAYFAGILRGLHMTGCGADAGVFLAAAFMEATDREQLLAASNALRALLDADTALLFRMFDQSKLN